MFCKKRKGQSTLEYVILTGFVVAALIAMGTYMKRGVQGKLRESTDQVGEQYDPTKTFTSYTTTTRQSTNEDGQPGGTTTTSFKTGGYLENKGNYENKKGSETVSGF